MSLRSAFLVTVLLAFGAGEARGQARIITGQVLDSLSGEPIAGGQVTVQGTVLEAPIRRDGTFSVGAPPQDVVLVVRSIGFRTKQVPVSVGQNVVEIRLARDVFRLDEIVITGQATGIERRNLANAVTTIRASDIEEVPAQSIEHALQGKVSGANIQTNSGAPGGGAQVQLRGTTSIIGASAPLYVVDGVIMSDVAIPSNQNAVTRASGGSNPTLTQDAQVNRIADLNPYDIESIEVLKGASAAAIYGSKAANGVVIIRTKRGRVGAPQVNLTQRFGFSDLSNKIGSRRFETLDEATDPDFGYGPAAADFYTPGVFFDHEELLAGRSDLSYETGASVSGGSETTRYFASGVWKDDAGIIDNTGFERQSLRLNLDQQFSDRFNVSIGSNLTHTLANRGLTNNDNAGVSYFMTYPFTPNFVDLRRNADGTFPDNPFIESNPLQTAALVTNDEDVWRLTGSLRADWELIRSATSRVRLIGFGGADYFSQENELFFPPELQFERIGGQPGTSLLSNSNNLNINLNGNLVWSYTPERASWSATTSAGIQYETQDLETARIVSRNLAGGLRVVSAGTNIAVTEERQRVEDLGLYVQEELLLLDERLLLTAGIRADQSSSNADPSELFFYPKGAASYRVSDAVKARVAYGESGNRPLFGQKFTPISPNQNIEGLPTLVLQPQVLPRADVASADLQPERQREIEGGVDLLLAGGRATLSLTGYQKSISDLLLRRALAPSSGFTTEIFNGGKMRVRGIEAELGLILAQGTNTNWVFRTTFSRNTSEITELPPEVPPFLTGGFGTALGAFRIEEGASATQIVGNDTLPDGSDIVRKLGDANPDFIVGFTNDLTVGAFNLFAHFHWQQGSEIVNLTKLLYDFGVNTEDFDEGITVGGEQVFRGANRLAGFGRQAGLYIEDGTFLKLRELTIAYNLPRSFVDALFGTGARYARLSLSGRNLLTFTGYTGHDPEVSNFGNQNIARNIDVAPFPPSRSFWFSIDLGL